MPKEKIGSDVLKGKPLPPKIPEQKQRELEQKLREELAKKREAERSKTMEEEGKLPKLKTPAEHVEAERVYVTEAEAEAMGEALKQKAKSKRKEDEKPSWAII